MDKRIVLEEHWSEIVKRVVRPLWHKGFKERYESVKMDYDDFESLAGLELTKAMENFDDTKANIYTYATNVLIKKARTELRDRLRVKRAAELYAVSMGEKTDEDSDMTFEDMCINQAEEQAYTCESDDMKSEILQLLRHKERNLAQMLMDEYSNIEIARELNVDLKWINAMKMDLATRTELRRLARRYGYLGGEAI